MGKGGEEEKELKYFSQISCLRTGLLVALFPDIGSI